MDKYDPHKIERKWQEQWEKNRLAEASGDAGKEKYYVLVEFPYPSGDGLHTGHVRSYTALDAVARKRRAEGFNVLYPMGWDAFGLPTENYALKTGIHPREVTKQNTDNFRRQLKSLGFSFDWSREINTTDPQYYKWTQWIFIQLFKHGLAYKAKMPINWCLSCKIGLANEEVVEGRCERCGGKTEKRDKEQWMLAITKYADRLHDDLDGTDYLERIKIQQRNWIGKSEGAILHFKIAPSAQMHADGNADERRAIRVHPREDQRASATLTAVNVFTTRPDTLFGATYLVIAPEHELIENLKFQIENREEVERYITESKKKSEIERTDEGKEKTGVELKGVKTINPATKEEIPVFVADYVLAGYGTGAIMAVPAHDERDHAFAQKYHLPITEVISGGDTAKAAYTGEGTLVNSGEFTGMDSEEARQKITEFVGGEMKATYRLRDWVFSRQRYWGEPIPLVFCEHCAAKSQELSEGETLNPGWVPVPEEDLPIELPDVKEYKPTDTGESPLAHLDEWVSATCPRCGKSAKRETDVMPNWAGSSWYYLRYCDPHNNAVLAGREKLEYWIPVDWYNGGMEHTTLHLLYSRFWHKFLYDIGVVPAKEPYQKRTSHGIVLAENGEKMSKSKGNVINPDEIVERFGADTLRIYELFMGPFDQTIAWSTDNMVGGRRFLERVWRLQERLAPAVPENEETERVIHQTIKKVGEDIESLKFNTAISQLMICTDALDRQGKISHEHYGIVLRLLAVFAPHLAEELYSRPGNTESVHLQPWPAYDETKIVRESWQIPVQVNGTVRAQMTIAASEEEGVIKERALSLEPLQRWLTGGKVQRVVYVEGKLVNIVCTKGGSGAQ